MNDAVEVIGPGRGSLVLTCEHASSRLPPPLRCAARDRAWLDTHWGIDIGIDPLARELSRLLEAPALLARFSRLVCDANRPPESPGLILEQVEGHPLSFNRGVDAAERARRLRGLYTPYHDAIDRALAACLASGEPALIALHSFTPVLGDDVRTLEVGVLFDEGFGPLARRLADRIRGGGFDVALNEPYSGFRGMIYSGCRHGRAGGVPYLELEVRQDLIDTAPRARAVAERLAAAVEGLPWELSGRSRFGADRGTGGSPA